jgi:hypothetical protein
MTTPASGPIGVNHLQAEIGAGRPFSFGEWFVRHIAKAYDGPISMSAMRGRTCYPINQFGANYINAEMYVPDVATAAQWVETLSNGFITIYTNGVQHWNAVSSTASRGYVDAGGVRYFRGSQRETGIDWRRYAIRAVA